MAVLRTSVLMAVLLAAMMTLSIAAGATVVDEETTYLTGTGAVQSIRCHAVVDLAGGVYTYSYDLTYLAGTSAVHIYKVQNPNYVTFYDADNVPYGEPGEFTDPIDGTTSWVQWIEGQLDVGGSRTFSYLSLYKPQEIDVWCYGVDGGSMAIGRTIGMSAFIPAPGSIVVVSMGILGLIPVVRRRRVV